MKRNQIIFCSILAITLSFNGISYGDKISGSADLSNHSFENLTVSGSADLKDLKVDKDLIVSGSFEGKNITADNISASGSASLENINVKNNLKVSGSFEGKNITVEGKTKISGGMIVSKGNFTDIEISASRIKLFDSKSHNILILESDSKQKLELKNSTISGDITFESGKGEIYLDSDSKILGKVDGAKVIKK